MRRSALWDEHSRGAHAPRRRAAPRTVVLGYDGSQAAQRATVRAADAAGSGGRVVVVTALPRTDLLMRAHESNSPIADADSLIEQASALLRRHDISLSKRVEQADPAEALAAAASDTNADLIVVGARGDSYLARALRGSVAERLVTRAPCDVLVVR
jgi:nucleotide-binding universal stress UspA family protein